ncbi:MAG: response regulator [Clostridia bacterium]|nr:response regulator [Clostridia bacterium]MBR4576558.1 response regulator [Clostridia bacterium]
MADWIIVVDDDAGNLKIAGRILSHAGMRVTALKSGRQALDYIRENGFPDLILLDVNMPDLDGFETMRLLKEEMEPGKEVPIVLLTADDRQDQESRGLESGAMDYIKKPFEPDVLVSRVHKILEIRRQMQHIARNAETDQLTGFMNKAAAEARMKTLCSQKTGLLCVLDLDSFKMVNDLFGHDTGDRVLLMFSDILKKNLRKDDECGRIGGDEFVVFLPEMSSEEQLMHFAARINGEYQNSARVMLGERLTFSTGVSIGAVSVPEYGIDYSELFHLADQALYIVKKNEKHGGRLYSSIEPGGDHPRELTLETITAILEEKLEAPSAMWMGRDAFGSIYKYMVRYMGRYHSSAFRVLLTVKVPADVPEEERKDIVLHFKGTIRAALRNSDVMMECGDNQLFLLLPEIQDFDINRVIGRLLSKWNRAEYSNRAEIACEYGKMHTRHELDLRAAQERWVVVVDDDSSALRLTEQILKHRKLKVTALSSGKELLEFLHEQQPDLILLDLMMAGMDGMETFREMRKEFPDIAPPVVFMTANEDMESEVQCLQLGAVDFIRKPIMPEMLTTRVQNILELTQLQKSFSEAVLRKTRETTSLSLHVAQTLAEMIDAKDQYTSRHSQRVAEYSREIARRFGYSPAMQDEIFMMGLLHDVGKIGIPDSILNKPGTLTDEEFDQIRSHPLTGAKILRGIQEMPRLVEGARWHHERYDGTGYPDHLAGKSIPEEARIIAVADAYDAMSSVRSYRDKLPKDVIRQEIHRCKGTQFDPVFAEIMLSILDEQPDSDDDPV